MHAVQAAGIDLIFRGHFLDLGFDADGGVFERHHPAFGFGSEAFGQRLIKHREAVLIDRHSVQETRQLPTQLAWPQCLP